MATYPLVGVQNDLGPLIKLSLEYHHILVTAVFDVFDVFDETQNGRFVAVATPLVEQLGPQKAYVKIFTALEDETFSTKTFLRLHTLVLSSDEFQAIRRGLKGGVTEVSLPKLAHLNDVIVHPIEDPKNVVKSGILHVTPSSDGTFLLTFGSLGASGVMKPRTISNFDRLKEVLQSFRIDINGLNKSCSFSVVGTSSLENLYRQGLV